MEKFELKTNLEHFYRITDEIQGAIDRSGVKEGICLVYCPHTTAGITVNENADEFVAKDCVMGIRNAFPRLAGFKHDEGNSDGHIKSSVIGCSETLIVTDGKLLLGRWQDVYFAEFDPPRERNFYVKIIEG